MAYEKSCQIFYKTASLQCGGFNYRVFGLTVSCLHVRTLLFSAASAALLSSSSTSSLSLFPQPKVILRLHLCRSLLLECAGHQA